MSSRLRSFYTSSTLWAYVLLLGLLGYVAALLGAAAPTLEVRTGLLRYWSLFGAGAFAVAFPHVLLPDARVPLLQMLNRSPARLLAYQWGQWVPVVGLFAGSAMLIAGFDPGYYAQDVAAKGTRLVEHLLVIVGTGAYSFAQYVTIGARSQAWQDGQAGQWYRQMKAHSPSGAQFAVPDGLVPAMFITGRVFVAALAAVIAGALLEPYAAGLVAWGPGIVLCAVAAIRIGRAQAVYDRHFYHTNAFYREVLGGDGAYVQARAPAAYEAIYWTPHRWRPAVWASLRQLDRVLPLGRLVALGHGLFWLLLIQGVGSAVIAGYLLLFIAAQNGACYVLTRTALAPPAFQLAHQSPLRWTITRFFVNLRWALPFALSLGVVALVDRTFTGSDVLFWVGIDVVVALAAAVLVTWAHEGTVRRRYA